ncbi:amidase family protein [Mycoplasma sp. 128]
MINKGNLQKALIEAANDTNNAVSYVYQDARLNNEGTLANCVYSLKSNYATKNSISHASSHILENFIPYYDATIVKLLQQAGATLAFKTHLDEFGLGGTGQFSYFGLVRNHLNKDYLAGGSSSGAAASFTENVGFAIGSDTGDSVRLPASYVGRVGFKPTYGAVSRYGLFAFASSLDTVAWFSHNVNDSFEIAQVLFKQDFSNDNTSLDLSFSKEEIKTKKPQKIAYLDCFDYLSKSVKESYQKLLNKLSQEGVSLQPVKVDEKLLKSVSVVYQIIAFTEASSNLANLNGTAFGLRQEQDNWMQTYIKTRQLGLGPMVQRRLILGSYYLEQENQERYLKKAQKMRRLLANYFANIHQNCDIFIYPAAKDVAPRFDAQSDESFMDYILTYANLVGNPSLTLPLGKNENSMPYSLAIDSAKYQDVKMLQHALWIEDIIKGEK